MKKIKCDVCNNDFFINKLDVYEVFYKPALMSIPEIFNAIDCPFCGCQIILKKRLQKNGEIVTKEKE